MRLTLTALLLVFLPLSLMAQSPPDSVDFRLDAHQWEHRLLFVFVPADASEKREAQEEAFAGTDAGFRDRDLLLITLSGGSEGTVREAPGADPRPLTDAAVERVYDRFSVPVEAYRVILVGKDGTEKRRDAEPVTTRSIFDTIDAMPMRQREMRDSSEEGT